VERRTPVVASHVTLPNRAAYGAAQALRLPKVGELGQQLLSGLGEPRIAALVRILDHLAAENLADRRLNPPAGDVEVQLVFSATVAIWPRCCKNADLERCGRFY